MRKATRQTLLVTGAERTGNAHSASAGGCPAFSKAAMRRGGAAIPARAPERERDVPPRRKVRRRARQEQDEAPDGGYDLHAQLEQPVPQPGHLRAGARRVGRARPQFLHQHVGGGSQEHAQPVRRERAATTRAVDLQCLQFLDPVLDVPAGAADLLVE